MKYDKYLPIGTVVLLKNATKKIMITGFCLTDEKNQAVFDYSGVLYPEGMISSEQNMLFNHTDISKIYHIGLIDEEEKQFKAKLKESIK